MTDYQISALTELTAPASGDLLAVVDVSDTSTPPAGAAGSDKKVTLSTLSAFFGGGGGGLYTVLTPSTPAANTTAVNSALAALTAYGGVVGLAPGNWEFDAPVVLGDHQGLVGCGGALYGLNDTHRAVVSGSASWAQGAAPAQGIIVSNGQDVSITGITVEGGSIWSSPSYGTADGVVCTSSDAGLHMSDVSVYNVPGHCVNLAASKGSSFLYKVAVGSASSDGVHGIRADSVLIGCSTNGNSGNGFVLTDPENVKLAGCKSEWNGGAGYTVSLNSGDTGGVILSGCSSDRNTGSAIVISASGATAPVTVSGFTARRDGANGTSAAITVNASASSPVIINGLSVFPGFNDDGTGNQGPVTGISVGASVTYVSMSGAVIHVVTTPVSGTITQVRSVATRTGSWNSPSSVTMLSDTA